MLEIRMEQERALGDNEFVERVTTFLRKEASLAAQAYSQAEIHDLVLQALVSGRAVGIRSERELAKWSLLGLVTKGACYKDETVLSLFRKTGDHPAKVHHFFTYVAAEIDKRR